MEKLLNKLIEKGWRPRWNYRDNAQIFWDDSMFVFFNHDLDTTKSLRELVSMESWLWQFVCENKFVKTKDRKVRYMYEDLERTQNYFSWYWYEYRLIESALKDEDDLEKFLLDNIKV